MVPTKDITQLYLNKEPDAEHWVNMLRQKHAETYQHCIRVAILAEKIAEPLGLSEEDKRKLIRGCFLHDIGKTMIPRDLIMQTQPLSKEQWNIIKLHPLLGAEIMEEQTGFDEKIINIVHYHHERWDGSGYPAGLQGEGIPWFARICSVIDAFDSMLSDRPYGRKLTPAEAKLELLRHAGKQFDTEVVHAFMTLTDQTLNIYSKD
jgi:putative nucleotidyltransferase with HDIG domain